MSDETKSKTAARSALEVILAAVGLWFAVSSFMALAGNQPLANPLTRPVIIVMGWIGVWPTLVASLGIAAVGTWSFLVRENVPWVQHTLGAIGVGLGLALGLGAFRPDGGGELGAVLPSLLSGALGVAAGAGVGLAVLLATAWMAWLPAEGFSAKPGEPGSIRAAGITGEGDGVSREEARALIAEPPRPPPAPLPRTPSLRDDVRTRGGVPEGTAPLPSLHDRPRLKTPDQALPGGEAAPAPRPGQPAGPHLAAPGAHALRAGGLLGRQVRPEEPIARATPALSDAAQPLAGDALAVPVQPTWERAGEPAIREEDEAPPEDAEAGAAAAWEALRAARPTPWEAPVEESAALEPLEQDLDLKDEEEEEEEEELLAEREVEGALELELDEVIVEEEAELDDDEEEEEEEEDGEELEQAPEEELLELAPAAEKPAAAADEGAEEELAAAADRGPEEVAEAPVGREDQADPDPEPKPEVRRRAPRKKRPAVISQSSLFDEGQSAAEAEELAVVEIPAVAPAPPAPARGAPGPSDLLLEAGNLILEQNRVAVSMLQRRFGLDFDAATEVLDQLQALGLIGPYLGGKTRDILLSREEWMALAQGA